MAAGGFLLEDASRACPARATWDGLLLLGLLRSAVRGIALGFGQLEEAGTFAGVLALAGVLRGLARGLALARVDAFALHLAFVGSGSHRSGREEQGGGSGQGERGSFTGAHRESLLT